MNPVRHARMEDCALLPAIEASGGEAFRAIGMGDVADNELTPVAVYPPLVETRTLWVGTDDTDRPIGFAACGIHEGFLYVYELCVALERQRKGHGRALMNAIISAARENGLRGIALRTFRDVTFNGPFYAGLGFAEADPPALAAMLPTFLETERRLGLDMSRRCTMVLHV